VRVDGNDVLASLAVTSAALDAARAGQGPTLIEAFTYRMNPHTTSDDATRYRSADELETWKGRDPLARVQTYLERQAGFEQDFFAAVDQEADKLAVRFRAEVRELPDISVPALFDNVYQTPPAELIEQRDELARSLNGHA
jgi:2-oxoisovalerate dehydrogenase E1 component alpha subunit